MINFICYNLDYITSSIYNQYPDKKKKKMKHTTQQKQSWFSIGLLPRKKNLQFTQQIPSDYISPWEAHHHYATLSRITERQNIKNKIPEYRQNVVHTFLQKIKKTTYTPDKSNIKKNKCQQDKQPSYHSSKNSTNPQYNVINIKSDYEEKRNQDENRKIWGWKKNLEKTNNKTNTGFGIVRYDITLQKKQKNSQICDQIENKFQQQLSESKKHLPYSSSYSIRQRKNTSKGGKYYSFYSADSSPQQKFSNTFHCHLKGSKQLGNIKSKSNKITTSEIRRGDLQNMIFVRKKKIPNQISVIDINETTEALYTQKMRHVVQSISKKYGKYGGKGSKLLSKNIKFLTEFQDQITKLSYSLQQNLRPKTQQAHIPYKFGSIKDRQSRFMQTNFFHTLKDQKISPTHHTIFRIHPTPLINY